VLFIDTGVKMWMLVECLAKMPPKFYYHPWQALPVALNGVEPPPDSVVENVFARVCLLKKNQS